MKIFIDTASVQELKQANALGVADGVTTNPTLLARESGTAEEIYRELCSTIDGPVCAETVSPEADAIVKEGRNLAKISDQIVIKVPAYKEGLIAVKQLESEGIRTNLTLVFSPMQALLAAKAGASFVCPFVGRLDDTSQPGMELIEQIVAIYHNYGYETEIIVASIRNPIHVRDAALMGAHAATLPLKVVEQLVRHPLSEIGIEKFLQDWKKVADR